MLSMALHVTIKFPGDLEERARQSGADLDAEVTGAFALELFRRGTLTHSELGRVLGLDRVETDAFLKRHGVFEGSLTMADLAADEETLRRVMGKTG